MSPTSARIAIPDVAGRDGYTVLKALQQLGLTDVSLSSTHPEYRVVMLASTWTAISIEPPPGTVVGRHDPVVVQVYKK